MNYLLIITLSVKMLHCSNASFLIAAQLLRKSILYGEKLKNTKHLL